MFVGWAAGKAPDIVGNRQAGDSSPAVSHTKKPKCIHEGINLLLRWAGLEHNRNTPKTQENHVSRIRGQGTTATRDEAQIQSQVARRAIARSKERKIRWQRDEQPGSAVHEAPSCIVGRNRAANHLLRSAKTLVKRIIANGEEPNSRSLWPPMYFVMACMVTSTP